MARGTPVVFLRAPRPRDPAPLWALCSWALVAGLLHHILHAQLTLSEHRFKYAASVVRSVVDLYFVCARSLRSLHLPGQCDIRSARFFFQIVRPKHSPRLFVPATCPSKVSILGPCQLKMSMFAHLISRTRVLQSKAAFKLKSQVDQCDRVPDAQSPARVTCPPGS